MRQNDSLKNFAYVTVGNTIGTALQAGFYLMFAAFLDPKDYGLLNYIIALAGTVSVLSRFGLPFTSAVYQAKGDYVLSNQATVFGLITTSVAAILLIPIEQNAALLCFASSLFVINLQNLLGEKKYKKYLWMYLFKSVSIITLPFLLYFVLEIPGILLGMSIGNLVASTNFFRTLSLNVNSFRNLKSDYRVIIQNFSVDASSSLSRTADKLFIVPFFGLTSAALYQLNLQIMLAVAILPMSLYSYLLSEESSGKKHNTINLFVIIISVLIALAVVFISPNIIEQFFPKYTQGILGLQVIIISVIPISINSILTAKLQAAQSTKVGLASLTKIVSLLVLIIVLGETYSVVGLSIAVLFSLCFESILLFILYKKLRSIMRY